VKDGQSSFTLGNIRMSDTRDLLVSVSMLSAERKKSDGWGDIEERGTDAPLLHRRIIECAIELRARHHDSMEPMRSSGVTQDKTQFSQVKKGR
jgi:hypothetical protein